MLRPAASPLLCLALLGMPTSVLSGPEIYRFDLVPTARAPGASGTGQLALAWSPFGVAVSEDGFLVYDLTLSVEGLLNPSTLGPYSHYVAWIASPNLERVARIGVLGSSGTVETRIESWNKFLILVTPESRADPPRRSGPIVLQGRSPSGFIASFQSHELFNLIPH